MAVIPPGESQAQPAEAARLELSPIVLVALVVFALLVRAGFR